MIPVLFLHSAVQDPYQVYQAMLAQNPIYRDESNRLWAVYLYEACKAILHNENALIPVVNPQNKDGLNEFAMLISGQLVRLSNSMEHSVNRQVALHLYNKMKTVVIHPVIE